MRDGRRVQRNLADEVVEVGGDGTARQLTLVEDGTGAQPDTRPAVRRTDTPIGLVADSHQHPGTCRERSEDHPSVRLATRSGVPGRDGDQCGLCELCGSKADAVRYQRCWVRTVMLAQAAHVSAGMSPRRISPANTLHPMQ